MQKNIINISPLFWLLPLLAAAFLFLPAGQAQKSPDAIAFRVVNNTKHHSPARWYEENIKIKGAPSEVLIDGYRAVRDGRTVYVGAANYDSGTIYTNIYIISYNQEAETATVDIFGQILSHWRFNINLETPGTCFAAPAQACINDRECSAGDYCTSLKGEVVRNTRRLADIADIETLLANYKNKNGKFPTLSAGSYRAQKTLSVWPSWQETLGKELGAVLPIDPVNRLGACPANFNPTTCWDEKNSSFAGTLPDDLATPASLPTGSEVYVYRVTPDGLAYTLSTTSVDPVTIIGGGTELTDFITNQPPQIEVPPGSTVIEGGITYINIVTKRDRPFEYFVRATDSDSDLGPISLWSYTPNNPSAWLAGGWTALPSISTTLNPEIKKLSAPVVGHNGFYYFTVSVNDGAGGSDTRRFRVSVDNLPPIVTVAPPMVRINVGKDDLVRHPIIITTADPEGNLPITYTTSVLPAGLSWNIIDEKTYQISGIPNAAPTTATTTVNLVFTDLYGASSAAIVTIVVVNHPPQFISTPVSTIRAGDLYHYQARATDADGHTVNYQFALTSGHPAGFTIDPNTGIVSGTPTGSGSFSIVIEANDGYGASALQNYALTVDNYCGDGVWQPVNMEGVSEQCDGSGNVASSPADSTATRQYACDAGCHYTGGYCSDGQIQTSKGEVCDDLNKNISDGCNSSCQAEVHWTCTGAPSICVPDTQTVACSSLLPTNAVWNPSPTVLQTWTGVDWQPPNTSSYSDSPGICKYKCPVGYVWNVNYCEKLCPSGTTKVLRHGAYFCQSAAYAWTHQLDHTAVINFHSDGTITYASETNHGALSTVPAYAYPFSYDSTIMFPNVNGTEYDLGVTGSTCSTWHPASTTVSMISISIYEPSSGEHVCTANIQKYIPL